MSFQVAGLKNKALSYKLKAESLEVIKSFVLGKRYELSVAFLSESRMRKAMKHRYARIAGKKTSNVLSFPYSKAGGEILICPTTTPPYTLEYLFIHACLHLKGLEHGATMEREEAKLLKKFGLRALGNRD